MNIQFSSSFHPKTASQLRSLQGDDSAIRRAIADWTALQNDKSASKHQFKRCALEKHRLYSLLQKIQPERPPIASFFPKAVIVPLSGGLTNANYKLIMNGVSFFARQSASVNELLNISLDKEYQASKAAGDAGIAPKVMLYSPQNGVLVTDFIDTAGKKVDLRDPEQMDRFCTSIRALHALPVILPGKLSPMDTIERYIKHAEEAGAIIPEMVAPLIEQLKGMQSDEEVQEAPCHNDLHAGNCLDDGERMLLIDWEYAAMGDPLFDLATLVSVEKFNVAELTQLLKNYLQKDSVSEEEIRNFCFKCALADARWGVWNLLQNQVSTIEFDYYEAALEYLESSTERLKNLNIHTKK